MILTFIDWFAGIGSMTLAFERAGAKCINMVEREGWKLACRPTGLRFYEQDVFDSDPMIADIWLASAGAPDLERWAHLVVKFSPSCLVIESGPQARLTTFLESINAQYWWMYVPAIDSRDFGLVQRRVRPYVVAYRKDINKHAEWLGSRGSDETFLYVDPAPEDYDNVIHAELAQGLPAGYTEPCGDRHHRNIALNQACAVPVVEWIARRVMEDLT